SKVNGGCRRQWRPRPSRRLEAAARRSRDRPPSQDLTAHARRLRRGARLEGSADPHATVSELVSRKARRLPWTRSTGRAEGPGPTTDTHRTVSPTAHRRHTTRAPRKRGPRDPADVSRDRNTSAHHRAPPHARGVRDTAAGFEAARPPRRSE